MGKKRDTLTRMDDWFARAAFIWERISAVTFSTSGGVFMAWLAANTKWAVQIGPLGWGMVGLATFLLLYGVGIYAQRALSRSRVERAQSLMTEHLAERASVNPLQQSFADQRINLSDLYSGFGTPLDGRHFIRCDLVGPAVILLRQGVVYRQNEPFNVEYMHVDDVATNHGTNKLTMDGGVIEKCRLSNVIILVPRSMGYHFETFFNDRPFPWSNGPLPPFPEPELPRLTPPPPPDAGTVDA